MSQDPFLQKYGIEPFKPDEAMGLGEQVWLSAKSAVGTAAQEALVELPQGIINFGISAAGAGYELIAGSQRPKWMADQLDFDIRRGLFLSAEDEVRLNSAETDAAASMRTISDGAAQAVGFFWGTPAYAAGKMGKWMLRGTGEKAARVAAEGYLAQATVRMKTAQRATNLTEKEINALKKAGQHISEGDAYNAWRNLAQIKDYKATERIGVKLRDMQFGKGKIINDFYQPGMMVQMGEMAGGFGAEAFLEGGQGPEGYSMESRLGAMFNAVMMAPVYAAAGFGRGWAANKMLAPEGVKAAWFQNPHFVGAATGGLEGLGYSVFEVGLLMEGIQGAMEGDYGKMKQFLEHAAGGALGFAFAHGVRPKQLHSNRIQDTDLYGPDKLYRESMERIKVDKVTQDRLWAIGVENLGETLEGQTLPEMRFKGPRGTPDKFTLVEGEGREARLLHIRNGHTAAYEGAEINEFLRKYADQAQVSMLKIAPLADMGFEHAGIYSGVMVSPNGKFNLRVDPRSRRMLEQRANEKGARWTPIEGAIFQDPRASMEVRRADPSTDEGMRKVFKERYGVDEKTLAAQKAVDVQRRNRGDFTPDEQDSLQVKKTLQTLRDYAVQEKLMEKGSIVDEMIDPLLRDQWEYAGMRSQEVSEFKAIMKSPEVLGEMANAIRDGNGDAWAEIVRRVSAPMAGITNAEKSIFGQEIYFDTAEGLRKKMGLGEKPMEAPKEEPKPAEEMKEPGLEDMSTRKLYEEAQRLGIKGRSKIKSDREALIESVRKEEDRLEAEAPETLISPDTLELDKMALRRLAQELGIPKSQRRGNQATESLLKKVIDRMQVVQSRRAQELIDSIDKLPETAVRNLAKSLGIEGSKTRGFMDLKTEIQTMIQSESIFQGVEPVEPLPARSYAEGEGIIDEVRRFAKEDAPDLTKILGKELKKTLDEQRQFESEMTSTIKANEVSRNKLTHDMVRSLIEKGEMKIEKDRVIICSPILTPIIKRALSGK